MGISIFIAIPLLMVAFYFLNREERPMHERLRGRDRLRLINRLGFFDEAEQSNQNDFKTSRGKGL